MTFDELLSLLPNCPGQDNIAIAPGVTAITYCEKRLKEFVAPNLSHREDIVSPSNPSIILISAAGVAGKSTIAKEIANQKNAPLIDLSRYGPVGEGSLNGLLMEGFGIPKIADVYSQLSSGDLFIVIDALDEARIKVNESAFVAFLNDITKLCQNGNVSKVPKFVLLGRTHIADDTWCTLDDAGIEPSVWTIEPFDREQAEQYIRLRIISSGAEKRMVDHKEPFEKVRNKIFELLESAISSTDTSIAREFLGYAPVLNAVSVLLAKERDYHELYEQLNTSLATSTPENRPLRLLQEVILRILHREQVEKLIPNLKLVLENKANALGWSSWELLYTEEEQIVRLLEQVLGQQVPPRDYASMPDELRADYEDQVKTFLPDHPFIKDGRLANAVFESYLFARALHEDIFVLSDGVEKYVSSESYRPSRLLADFYLSMMEESQGNMPHSHIGLLYRSLTAGETDALRVYFSLEGDDPEDEDVEQSTKGEFELVYVTGQKKLDKVVKKFTVEIKKDMEIHFGRRLREASIVVPCNVSLGQTASEVELGPNVYIRCGQLNFSSSNIVILNGSKTEKENRRGVILEALGCSSIVNRPTVHGELRVNWPGAESYPWNDFYIKIPSDFVTDKNLMTVYRCFRRIVTTLASHGRGGLAKFKEKIEHRRVLKGIKGEELLKQLQKDNILTLKANHYHWNPAEASNHLGISWNDIDRGDIPSKLADYLKQFITMHKELFR